MICWRQLLRAGYDKKTNCCLSSQEMGGLSCFRAVLSGIFIIVFVRAPCEAFLCGDNSNALVWPCTPFKSFRVLNEHIAYDQNIKHSSISFHFIYLCLFFTVKMLTICKNNMLLEWRDHGGHITAPLHCRKANQLKVILWFLLSMSVEEINFSNVRVKSCEIGT